jgi:hypothetical protein
LSTQTQKKQNQKKKPHHFSNLQQDHHHNRNHNSLYYIQQSKSLTAKSSAKIGSQELNHTINYKAKLALSK